MNFEIVIKDEEYDRLFCLMNNIDEINEGDEIGAWLIGDWSVKEDQTLKLKIEKFIIPKQKVSRTEVDISPESMIDTIREIGCEQSNRIKGHWHIHPFASGTTDWSSIDEAKITDFMSPDKNRQIFAWLLSSKTELKARIEIVTEYNLPILKQKFKSRQTFDNLEVTRENGEEENHYLAELKETISTKVERNTPSVKEYWGFNTGIYGGEYKFQEEDYSGDTYLNSLKRKQPLAENSDKNFEVIRSGEYLKVKMSKDFAKFIEGLGDLMPELLECPDHVKNKATYTQWSYNKETLIEAMNMEDDVKKELETLSTYFLAERGGL